MTHRLFRCGNFRFYRPGAGRSRLLSEKSQISRIHGRIENRGNEVYIVDMNSANGTFRNGERLEPGTSYVLHTGDILKLADLEFICQ